jgi:hypothetical protein
MLQQGIEEVAVVEQFAASLTIESELLPHTAAIGFRRRPL